MDYFPKIDGQVQVADAGDRIVIAGDRVGLIAIASLLTWLANCDQDKTDNLANGDRAHIHLTPGTHISGDSKELEICRLDAKGTRQYPTGYIPT